MEVNDGKISIICPINSGKENVVGYLPNDIINTHELSYSQKLSAKKAILWLLAKAPHTVNEAAEHFALSPELVTSLVAELIRSGEITSEIKPLGYRAGRQSPSGYSPDTLITYYTNM